MSERNIEQKLTVALESASSKLKTLKGSHPEIFKDKNPKSATEMLIQAIKIHAENKDKSLITVAIESYEQDLNLDSTAKSLLEGKSKEE